MSERKWSSGTIYPGCPQCGATSGPLLWSEAGDGSTRTYRCPSCGKRWTVEGQQSEMFEVVGAVEVAVLQLEGS